jgi:hypothetical protein
MRASFKYDIARLIKVSVSLTPLILCPILLSEYGGHADLVFTLFGGISIVWLTGIVVTAIRFSLQIDADALTCRGRFSKRTILFSSITSISLRQGRDRAGRFVTASPLRELVIKTRDKTLVLSSIPLGDEGMERVIELLQTRLPQELWTQSPV